MNRNNSRARRARRAADIPRIAIPHSSWSRMESASGGSAQIAPADFWARLGL